MVDGWPMPLGTRKHSTAGWRSKGPPTTNTLAAAQKMNPRHFCAIVGEIDMYFYVMTPGNLGNLTVDLYENYISKTKRKEVTEI